MTRESNFKIYPAKLRRWSWRRRKSWYLRVAQKTGPLPSGNPVYLEVPELSIPFLGAVFRRLPSGELECGSDILSFIFEPLDLLARRRAAPNPRD